MRILSIKNRSAYYYVEDGIIVFRIESSVSGKDLYVYYLSLSHKADLDKINNYTALVRFAKEHKSTKSHLIQNSSSDDETLCPPQSEPAKTGEGDSSFTQNSLHTITLNDEQLLSIVVLLDEKVSEIAYDLNEQSFKQFTETDVMFPLLIQFYTQLGMTYTYPSFHGLQSQSYEDDTWTSMDGEIYSSQSGSSFLDFILFALPVSFFVLVFIGLILKFVNSDIITSECYEKDLNLTCAEYVIDLKNSVDSDYKPFHDYLSESYSDGRISLGEYSSLKRKYSKYSQLRQEIKDDEKQESLKLIFDEQLNN